MTTAIIAVKEVQSGFTGKPVVFIRVETGGGIASMLDHATRAGDALEARHGCTQNECFTAGTYAAALVASLVGEGHEAEVVPHYMGQMAEARYEITRAKHNARLIIRAFAGCEGRTWKGVREGWAEVFYGRVKDAALVVDLIEQSMGEVGFGRCPVKIEAPKPEKMAA